MKRLLLIPAIALVVFACREKHVTSAPVPPAPDPNAYSTAPVNIGEDTVTTVTFQHVEVTTNTTTTNTNGTVSSTTTSDTVVTNVTMPADSNNHCRLVVSFISKGEGIDLDAKGKFDKWLAKDNGGFTYTTVNWGREGEMNYCFNMASKTAQEQANFVHDVQIFLKDNDRILVREWGVCDPKALQQSEVQTQVLTDTANIARLVVSFISKGEGIDYKTEESFKAWLAERPQFTYEVTHWGREGEANYCFRMSNIDGRQQESFIRDVRTFMTDKELVIVSEWEKCDKRK